jgi:hypothetical protein
MAKRVGTRDAARAGVGRTIANSTFCQEESVKTQACSAILFAALSACAPAAPSSGGTSPGTIGDADVPPVMSLLSERERLSLSSGQVEELESIARDWETTNDELTRQIGAVKGRAPNPVRLAFAKRARLASSAIAENNMRTAMAVAGVLSPAQRHILCTVERLRATSAVRAKHHGGNVASVIGRKSSRDGDARVDWPWCASVKAETASAN